MSPSLSPDLRPQAAAGGDFLHPARHGFPVEARLAAGVGLRFQKDLGLRSS
jgi:hypothetical protein